MLRTLLAASAALVCVLGSGHTATAALIMSGSTHPVFPSGVNALVSVAVYDKAGGVSGDSFGTGFAGFDTSLTSNFTAGVLSHSYLYLYQIQNTGSFAINSVNLPAFTAGISYGELTGFSFSPNPIVPGATGGNPAAFFSGGAVSILSGQSNTHSMPPLSIGGANFLQVFFTAPTLLPGANSNLLGFTSDLPPNQTATVGVNGGGVTGGTSANGILPANGPLATPEPATMATFGLLVIGGGFVARRKLRRTAAPETVVAA